MKNLLYCRRTFICSFALMLMAALSAYKGIDGMAAMAAVAVGLAGANAFEKSTHRTKQYKDD